MHFRTGYPMAVFIVYGAHWCSLAYAQDPSHNLLAGFTEAGGATGAAWNTSQGFHNVTSKSTGYVQPSTGVATRPLSRRLMRLASDPRQLRLPSRLPPRQRPLRPRLLRPRHALRLHRRC